MSQDHLCCSHASLYIQEILLNIFGHCSLPESHNVACTPLYGRPSCARSMERVGRSRSRHWIYFGQNWSTFLLWCGVFLKAVNLLVERVLDSFTGRSADHSVKPSGTPFQVISAASGSSMTSQVFKLSCEPLCFVLIFRRSHWFISMLSWDDECARRLRTRTDKPFVGAGDEDSN